MSASGETQEAEASAAGCRTCGDGRMGAWIAVRAGSGLVLVGELAVAGRICDRCHSVELQARKRSGGTAPDPRSSRKSAGGALLEGVMGNVRVALGELWRLVRRKGG